ncbi:hypothetical protein QU814_08775 [Providencia rettgeri]|nr:MULTISPECIES: hypothetical protein [Providencia]MDK3108912.1 hypothetical protein [Providencia rettgeri]MDL9984855.1 hypothetical protein [Providencia rettgeri]MDL9986826.1 hypothetical protein [Providencia rettgeri]MDM9283272.1 hypothetical protein [Providencia rettgeri]MDT5429860.1 hypothetical protein [Providencia rettgeri]
MISSKLTLIIFPPLILQGGGAKTTPLIGTVIIPGVTVARVFPDGLIRESGNPA